MNSQEITKQKNSEKIIDDLFNFCKKANLKKIENILSSTNNITISNFIIDEAIRIVIRNYNGQNPDFLKSLTSLLKFNTDINFKNESQNHATILMEAACSEKIEVLQTILNFFDIKKSNANANTTGNNLNSYASNKTPSIASSPNSGNIDEKKAGANNSKYNKIKNESISTSENFNNNNSNINNNCLDLSIKDNFGQTVLHKIINMGTLNDSYKFCSLKLLIEKGANVNEENILGYSSLSLALLLGNSALTEYLIINGADINLILSANNENMLHCAVRGKNPAVIPFLQNADLKHKNKHGETPIDLANNLKLLSFKDFFNKIDADNSDINLNNKIISSMIPINDIINKNYVNVLLHLQELKTCLKINNSEMRFIWNTLLAEYYSYFENELLVAEGQISEKINYSLNSNNINKSVKNNIYQQNNECGNHSLRNILGSDNININNNNLKQQENFNSSNINLNVSTFNSNTNTVPDIFSAGKFVVKSTSINKNNAKRNRKISNASGNTNAFLNTNATITVSNINNNNNNLINLIEINNNDNDINQSKSRQYFIEKFMEFFINNDISQTDNEHKKILHYNSGLFWFKFSSYAKCFEQLFNCLKINSKKDNFLFYTNSSLIFINILQNLQEFQLAYKLIDCLEAYLNSNQSRSINKLSNKSILNSVNSGSSSQMSQLSDEKQDLLNSPNKKSLINLYNQRELLNKSNSHEELNCILNILKSQNFLYEEKIEDCRKYIKEYKRLWNILIIKESFPMLNTLKKIYHVLKIRLHYMNNTISKGLKHLNFLSNFFCENDQEDLQMKILKLNNFGVLNLKQKKFSLAQFNFKNALNLLRKFSPALNFNSNISQMAESLLFNLALSYFFDKNFEACYNTLKKIKNGKIINNPFFFYRLGISCLETELAAVKQKNTKETYNEILEKFVVKNSQFNSSEKNTIVDYSNRNNESTEANKIQNSSFIKSPANIDNSNIIRSNSPININTQNEIINDNSDNCNKTSLVFNSFYILKNTENLFLQSEKIAEAIDHFISVNTLIKNFDNLLFHKELSELCDFYNLNTKNTINQIFLNNNINDNNNKNRTNRNVNNNANNYITNVISNQNDDLIKSEQVENPKTIPKTISKSLKSILISSYLNLLFCLCLKKRWTEMLFYIRDLESISLPLLKEQNYTLDNYKIEAHMGLNQSYKVIELLKKNMANGNYTYSCLDSQANFFSKVMGDVSTEINLKIALYSNVIKLNFLNNNLLEVEKGIVKIIGLLNMNLNLNQNIENISLPSYLINLLIYYYLIKENFDTAIYLIKKRKLPPGSFGFLLESTSKNF
jgi:hypothetical protein